METILIVIHLMIVIALVIVVLLQRSEGGALGIGGGGGGLMSARGAANALTRTTGILAAAFFVTSLSLGILARYGGQPTDILDRLPTTQGGGDQGGSLLDQLGALPKQDGASGNADQAPQADAAATDVTPSDPNAPSAAPSMPESTTGTAVPQSAPAEDASTPAVTPEPQIPANPAPAAPNAAGTRPGAEPSAAGSGERKPAVGTAGGKCEICTTECVICACRRRTPSLYTAAQVTECSAAW